MDQCRLELSDQLCARSGHLNSGYNPAPGATSPVTNQTLAVTIPDTSNFYLAWNYSVSTGTTTTNGQALAIDDISILGVGNTQTNPTATAAANPSTVQAGSSTSVDGNRHPGSQPRQYRHRGHRRSHRHRRLRIAIIFRRRNPRRRHRQRQHLLLPGHRARQHPERRQSLAGRRHRRTVPQRRALPFRSP